MGLDDAKKLKHQEIMCMKSPEIKYISNQDGLLQFDNCSISYSFSKGVAAQNITIMQEILMLLITCFRFFFFFGDFYVVFICAGDSHLEVGLKRFLINSSTKSIKPTAASLTEWTGAYTACLDFFFMDLVSDFFSKS